MASVSPRNFQRTYQQMEHMEEANSLEEENSEPWEDESEDGYKPKEIDLVPTPLPETMYGLFIASLIRDTAEVDLHGPMKFVRMVIAFALYLMTIILQIFLIVSTKTLITPKSVKEIREIYDIYERTMYTDSDGVAHITNSTNGYARGIDGFFVAENFANLGEAEQELICSVPFSQRAFIFCLLWIWLIRVTMEMRTTINLLIRFICLKTTSGTSIHTGHSMVEGQDGTVNVDGLPCCLKLFIAFVVLIPRICLSTFVAWMGCRWLAATLGFNEVLLNALALAFIFELNELIFMATVPYHSKVLVTHTVIPHTADKEPENCRTMFGLLIMNVVAAVLASSYLFGPLWMGPFSQHILPEYNWDVAVVCKKFLASSLIPKKLPRHGF